MGNELSAGPNRMAISAMAHVVKCTYEYMAIGASDCEASVGQRELQELQREFAKISHKHENRRIIDRADFRELLTIVDIKEADKEILERVFTLFDETGEEQIDFQEFLVGISPMVHGSVVDKLLFAFQLHDKDGTGKVSKADMVAAFSYINKAASFFGDEPLSADKVQQLVNDIFAAQDAMNVGELVYAEHVQAIAAQPILVEFVRSNSAAGAAAAAAAASAIDTK